MYLKAGIAAMIVGALALASLTPARADFVQNGSFEAVQIGSPYYSITPSDVPGWTHTGTLADALLFNTHYVDGGGSITVAGDGNQFAVVGKSSGPSGTGYLSQTLTGLTPGRLYNLTFKIASLFPGTSQNLQVDFTSGSSTLAQIFTAEPSSSAYYKIWDSEAMTFLATDSSVGLRFGEAGQHDTGLDAISVTEAVDAATPEPGSLALLLSLGVIGVGLRRRKHPLALDQRAQPRGVRQSAG